MGEFAEAERFECLKHSFPFMEMDPNLELMRQLAELSGSAMQIPSMGLMDYSDEYYLPHQPEFSIPFIDDLTGPPAECQKPIAASQPAGSVGEQSHGGRKRKMIAESNASSHHFSEVYSVIGSAEVNTKKKNVRTVVLFLDKKKSCGRRRKSNSKEAGKPKEVVHVRARRGQATDSHSLAERVSTYLSFFSFNETFGCELLLRLQLGCGSHRKNSGEPPKRNSIVLPTICYAALPKLIE
ncbi:hypothetical protein BHM03_00030204 [Ensete ventricosum]|nr:hypothetical protein BHM03_00030204 [Ensete ventricosum]